MLGESTLVGIIGERRERSLLGAENDPVIIGQCQIYYLLVVIYCYLVTGELRLRRNPNHIQPHG